MTVFYQKDFYQKENKMDEVKPDVAKEMKSNIGSGTHLVAMFDTTGSMKPAIEQVRQKLRDLVEMMSADILGLKIGLIAHGDYCDGDKCMTSLDFTDDLEKIMQFINNTPNTGGGDAPECYEFALQTAKNLSWPKEGGSVIIIGDDEPHPVGYQWQQTINQIDWQQEVKEMAEKNIKVFPMQCLYNASRTQANEFWEGISQLSGTPLLMLESFGDGANALEAVAYASSGAAAMDFYESKVSYETEKGMRSVASANINNIRSKLAGYAKSNVKSDPAPDLEAESKAFE